MTSGFRFFIPLFFISIQVYAQRQSSPADIDKMQQQQREMAMSIKGKPVTPFAVNDLNNSLVSSELLKGGIYVLNFWFVACKPCIAEMPELNALVKKYRDTGVKFIALSLDKADKVRKFLRKNKFDYTLIPDAKSLIMKDFNIHIFPTHVIIDKQNKVRYYTAGYSRETVSVLDKNLEVLLNE